MLPLALVLVLGASAFIAVALLQEHADSSRRAQVKLGQLQLALGNVNAYCWEANPELGGNAFYAHHQIEAAKATIAQILASLRREQPLPVLDHAPAVLRANYAVADQIYKIGSVRGYGPWIDALGRPQGQTAGAAFGLVGRGRPSIRAARQDCEDALDPRIGTGHPVATHCVHAGLPTCGAREDDR